MELNLSDAVSVRQICEKIVKYDLEKNSSNFIRELKIQTVKRGMYKESQILLEMEKRLFPKSQEDIELIEKCEKYQIAFKMMDINSNVQAIHAMLKITEKLNEIGDAISMDDIIKIKAENKKLFE